MYEIGYLMNPFVAEDKIDEEVALLREAIESNGGLISADSRPQMRKLAYVIKITKPVKGTFENALFGWLKFTAEADEIAKINEGFTKNTKIIRFLTIIAGKENGPTGTGIRRAKTAAPAKEKKEGKAAIKPKPEEIDKRLEELVGKEEMAKEKKEE